MRINTADLSAVAAVLAFLFVCAGFISQWRVSKNTALLVQYREIAKGWQEKSSLQATEIADLQESSHKKDALIAELQGKVAVLQDALTGKASWDILEHAITQSLIIAEANQQGISKIIELLAAKST